MEKKLNLFGLVFLGCLFFWAWFTWYSVQREQVRQCAEHLEQCQKDYYKNK